MFFPDKTFFFSEFHRIEQHVIDFDTECMHQIELNLEASEFWTNLKNYSRWKPQKQFLDNSVSQIFLESD